MSAFMSLARKSLLTLWEPAVWVVSTILIFVPLISFWTVELESSGNPFIPLIVFLLWAFASILAANIFLAAFERFDKVWFYRYRELFIKHLRTIIVVLTSFWILPFLIVSSFLPPLGVGQGSLRLTETSQILAPGQTVPRTLWHVSSVGFWLSSGRRWNKDLTQVSTQTPFLITLADTPTIKTSMTIKVQLRDTEHLRKMLSAHAGNLTSALGLVWGEIARKSLEPVFNEHLSTILRSKATGSNDVVRIRLGNLIQKSIMTRDPRLRSVASIKIFDLQIDTVEAITP